VLPKLAGESKNAARVKTVSVNTIENLPDRNNSKWPEPVLTDFTPLCVAGGHISFSPAGSRGTHRPGVSSRPACQRKTPAGSLSLRAELAGLPDMSQPHPLACGGSQSALSRSRVDSLARFHRARPRHGRDLGSGVPGGSRRARRPLYITFLRRSRQAGGCITRPGMGSLTTMCATGCHRSGYMAPNCGDHAAPFTPAGLATDGAVPPSFSPKITRHAAATVSSGQCGIVIEGGQLS
jgi:hypothetical protein